MNPYRLYFDGDDVTPEGTEPRDICLRWSYATYFGRDDVPIADTEAPDICLRCLSPERVLSFDGKDYFWEMRATGPWGPCTLSLLDCFIDMLFLTRDFHDHGFLLCLTGSQLQSSSTPLSLMHSYSRSSRRCPVASDLNKGA